MNKYQITKIIEDYAPLDLQEKWDCSGWLVETDKQNVEKVMLCLTVTDDIVKQAKTNNCDMIISHHPLFSIDTRKISKDFQPLLDIYCAHTNMDRTQGGTTDTLIKNLQFDVSESSDFVRYVDLEIGLEELTKKLCKISNNVRVINNKNASHFHKIAFCAGSGSEFIQEAKENNADVFITGDIKFHTATDSNIVLFDIGHFESEIFILNVFADLLKNKVEVIFATEQSPFKSI